MTDSLHSLSSMSVDYAGTWLALCALLTYLVSRFCFVSTKASVPVVGSPALFGYLTALKVTTGGFLGYLNEGFAKYQSRPFQIPTLRAWIVYLPAKYFHEVRKASGGALCGRSELNEIFATEYTIEKSVATNNFHFDVTRRELPSRLASLLPAIYDEISAAFDDEIGKLSNDEWKPVPAAPVVERLVARASNRLFVGLPLCRNEEYNTISIEFAATVAKAGMLISMVPQFLRPTVAAFVSKAPVVIKAFQKYLLPLIDERRRLVVQHSDEPEWDDKPNDLMQWLVDASQGTERSSRDLALGMSRLIFAAVRTTAENFTHTLFNLAANPQYIIPLRAEVEEAVKVHGWTKDALADMYKVDSFLKESMRIGGLETSGTKRKVVKTFSLSDGTVLRAGQHIATNMWAIHHDPSLYDEPETFDPFRFSRKFESGEATVSDGLGTTSSSFLAWGAGPHSCAGRAFASAEMKAMLAHIVLHYDIRLEDEGVRPEDTWLVTSCLANREAKVLFRGRQPTPAS